MLHDLLVNVGGTIIGGVILAAFLFAWNEFIIQRPELSGEWIVRTRMLKTTYNPYKDLEVEFKFHLLDKAEEVCGSGEKIKDIYPNGEVHEYPHAERVLVSIDGYLHRRYLRGDYLVLNVVEKGTKRESRATYRISATKESILTGTFISTAANASGTVTMSKES